MRLDSASVGRLFGDVSLPESLSVMRNFDRYTAILAVVSAIFASVIAVWLLIEGSTIREVFPYLTIPMVACGALFFLRRRYWVLIIATILLAAMYIIGVSELVFYLGFLLILGIPGCISISSVISRSIFYRVLRNVECVSMLKKVHLKERAIMFIMGLPKGFDTRNLVSNCKMRRDGIPWKDVLENIILALMVETVLWICIVLEHGLLNSISLDDTALYMLSIVVFIPMFVLPFVLFRSLNVRIVTDDCDVHIFEGIRCAVIRAFFPLAVVLLISLVTVESSGLLWVLTCIIMSASMTIAIMTFASIFYYDFSEPSLINDVNRKWKMFRPVSVMSTVSVSEKSHLNDVPGTPIRDRSEYGILSLPNNDHSKS